MKEKERILERLKQHAETVMAKPKLKEHDVAFLWRLYDDYKYREMYKDAIGFACCSAERKPVEGKHAECFEGGAFDG